MKLKSSSAAMPTPELIDAVMDAYLTWRERSAAVESAYRTWSHASTEERARSFDIYSAALDREELAAGDYQRLVAQVETL